MLSSIGGYEGSDTIASSGGLRHIVSNESLVRGRFDLDTMELAT